MKLFYFLLKITIISSTAIDLTKKKIQLTEQNSTCINKDFSPDEALVYHLPLADTTAKKNSIDLEIDGNCRLRKVPISNSQYTKHELDPDGKLNIDDVFVKTFTEAIAFMSLYRTNLTFLFNIFLTKQKRNTVKNTNNKEVVYKDMKFCFKEVTQTALDFYKKEDALQYIKKLIVKEVHKKDYKKFVLCVTKKKRNYFKKKNSIENNLKQIKSYETFFGQLLSHEELCCVNTYKTAFQKLFPRIREQQFHQQNFICFFSFLYKLNTYFNDNLKSVYQEFLLSPPSLEKNCIKYCLDEKVLQSDPYYFIYWGIDWILYLLESKTEFMSCFCYTSLQLNNINLTKCIILLFCAMQKKQVNISLLKDDVFINKWASSFSSLIIYNASNYKQFVDFEEAITKCCYFSMKDLKSLLIILNLEHDDEKTAFTKIKKEIISYFQNCHNLIYAAYTTTINSI